jgi:hypothetical protein
MTPVLRMQMETMSLQQVYSIKQMQEHVGHIIMYGVKLQDVVAKATQ